MNIIDVLTTGCSCMTKAPELAFHKEDCKLRMAWLKYFSERPPSTDKGQNDE